MFRSRFLLAATVAAAALLAVPATSQAAFTVALTQTDGLPSPAAQGAVGTQAAFGGGNGATLTVTDQFLSGGAQDLLPLGTIFDSNAVTGNIVLGQRQLVAGGGGAEATQSPITFGAFSIGFNGTRSSSTSGANVIGSSGTTIVSNSSTETATLRIVLKEDAFTLPDTVPGKYEVKNTLTILSFSAPVGAVGSSLTSTSFVTDNPAGNTATVSNSVVGITPTPTTAVAYTTWDRTTGTYSIVHTIELTLAAGATIEFQTRTDLAVPAPAGVVLLASALPFAVGLRRRFRKATPATAA